jgi:cyclopropane-fatty-acyl-phospholipid synthase
MSSLSFSFELESNPVKACPICLQSSSDQVLNLPNYPVTEFFAKDNSRASDIEIGYDQDLQVCNNCHHMYLGEQLLPRLIYNQDYQTFASASVPAQQATMRFLNLIDETFPLNRFNMIMDIGANDGSLLRQVSTKNFKGRKFAIDPSFSIWDSDVTGFTSFVEDFDFSLLSEFSSRLFVASHVLEHVANPSILIQKLTSCVRKEDVVVFQFPAIEPLIYESRFDQIHHQHYHYFSYLSFKKLLKDSNFEVVKSVIDWKHYGAAVVFLKRRTTEVPLHYDLDEWQIISKMIQVNQESARKSLENFSYQMEFVKSQIRDTPWVSIGAGLMSPIIFYHLQGTWDNCMSIFDDNQTKSGKRYANTPCAIERFPDNLTAKLALLTGSVSRLAGRELFSKISKMNIDKILIPVTTI